MQTEVRENQKEETRGRKAFLRVDDKKELKDPPRIRFRRTRKGSGADR
jgi:hypothetical protein